MPKFFTDRENIGEKIVLTGDDARHIGRVLGRNHQTINNEVKRGTVTQINRVTSNGKDYTYSDDLYFADDRLEPHMSQDVTFDVDARRDFD